jgi:hypothetical protein
MEPVFCVDARVMFTPDESKRIGLYNLFNQVIYRSEEAKRHLAAYEGGNTGSVRTALVGLARITAARMSLNLTVRQLQSGKHIECKSLEEMIGAQDAIMTAFRNLKGYLDTAATFDGREILIEFNEEGEEVIATSATPQLALADKNATSYTPSIPINPKLVMAGVGALVVVVALYFASTLHVGLPHMSAPAARAAPAAQVPQEDQSE